MVDCRKASSCLIVVVLAAGLGACGGDGPTKTCPPGTTGSPPNCQEIRVEPCTQQVVSSDFGSAKSRTLYHDDFSVPDNGRLDITVDYTFAASRIGVYLTPANTCTLEEFNARTCNFLARSEPPGAKPRMLSLPNFTAGNYRWLVANFSDSDESVSQQFVLSKGPCPALTVAPPSILAGPAGDDLTVRQGVSR
jgi:hypothetical protein